MSLDSKKKEEEAIGSRVCTFSRLFPKFYGDSKLMYGFLSYLGSYHLKNPFKLCFNFSISQNIGLFNTQHGSSSKMISID